MKPKIIELKQTPVVLVEKPNIEDNDIVIVGGCEVFLNGEYYPLPRGEWGAVGILSDLTEEQFAECVDKVNFESGPVYKNYKTFKGLGKASEAFDTLLESEKVYMDNPYEHLKEGMTFAEECENKWQEAQSRTIDPTRTVVLIKSK